MLYYIFFNLWRFKFNFDTKSITMSSLIFLRFLHRSRASIFTPLRDGLKKQVYQQITIYNRLIKATPTNLIDFRPGLDSFRSTRKLKIKNKLYCIKTRKHQYHIATLKLKIHEK